MVPVIIPFYKNEAQLEKCIAHLKVQTTSVDIFVRDNSVDNIYFTAAVNEGLKRYLNQDCRYIIILNQDMYLEPIAVKAMVDFMDDHPKCGIGTPLQLHPENANHVICAGSYEAFPFGRHQSGELSLFGEDSEIYWGNGACMILRKEMVQEIGLLDQNLVFLGSDSDYCFTARSRGWEVWRISKARGIHEHGASGATSDLTIGVLKLNDMIYFGQKWLTGDLYKSLAYDGKDLTTEKINQIFNRLEQSKLSKLELAVHQFTSGDKFLQ